MLLTRDQILGAKDIQCELVSVPEWGGDVWVYGLTARQRDLYEAGSITIKDGKAEPSLEDARARLAVLAIRDEKGSRMFNDLEIRFLAEKSAAALDRIYDVACRLSGIRKEDMDGLEKNSASAPGGDSSSS